MAPSPTMSSKVEMEMQLGVVSSLTKEMHAKLNCGCAVHRNLTWHMLPTDFLANQNLDPTALAKTGLFITADLKEVRCHFCNFSAIVEVGLGDQIHLQHTSCQSYDKEKDILIPEESNTNFNYEACRLFSILKKKSPWEYVNPLELAEAGFFYSGEGDKCRCAYCKLDVDGWEKDDTAIGEHKRWNPTCPFYKTPENVINIKIGEEPTGLKSDAFGKNKEGSKQMSEEEIRDVAPPPPPQNQEFHHEREHE